MEIVLLQYYSRNSNEGISWLYIVLGVLLLIIIVSALRPARMRKVLSHWHHRFDEPPFAPKEFYETVEKVIESKELKLTISRILYAEGGFLSPRRKYLRIQYYEYLYDICAAPFGKGYFVSWWLGEEGSPIQDMFVSIPFIGKWFASRPKTFFELDNEIMFKETVSECVKEAIEQLTTSKGLRKLSEADWKEYNRAF